MVDTMRDDQRVAAHLARPTAVMVVAAAAAMSLDGTMHNATADQANIDALYFEAEGYKWWGIISHITFFVLIGVSWRYKLWFVVAIAIPAMLLSIEYHACVSWRYCAGIDPVMARRNDHLSAQLCLLIVFYVLSIIHDNDMKPGTPLTVLDAEQRRDAEEGDTMDSAAIDADEGDMGMELNPPAYQMYWREIYVSISILATALVTYNWPVDQSIFTFYVTLVFGLMGWLIYVILRVERPLQSTDTAFMLGPTQLHWPMFAAFVALGAIAIGFFLMPESVTSTVNGVQTNIPTSFGHSIWHAVSPLAITALVLAKELKPLDALYVIST